MMAIRRVSAACITLRDVGCLFSRCGVRGNAVIVPQDEFMLQAMLGVTTVPADVADEYLKRVRYLHRATSGGPMGAGMLVDILRFLGYESTAGVKTPEGQVDWRSVKIGTRVNARRAGRWSLAGSVCRFAGFVDSGTLAVEVPGGRVDEFMRFDVRIAIEDTPAGIDPKNFKHQDGLQDVRLEHNAMIELLDKVAPSVSDDIGYSIGGRNGDSVSDIIGDIVSHESSISFEPEPDPEADQTPDEDELPEIVQVDWKAVSTGTPVYARLVALDGESELHDAKFQRRLKNGKIVVVLNGEEAEKFLLPVDCQLP